jgi:hypothetical protein
MAVAIVALCVSLGGGAFAAGHYLITSKRQISPKVLKALKGKRGATGPIGPTGPAGQGGQPGAAGAPGDKGDKGDIGPSTVYAVHRDETVGITATPVVVATIGGLPSSSYVIHATTDIDDETTIEHTPTCTLNAGGDTDQHWVDTSSQAAGDVYRSEYALQVVHSFAATGSAVLSCSGGAASSVTAGETKITAIRVGSIASNIAVTG